MKSVTFSQLTRQSTIDMPKTKEQCEKIKYMKKKEIISSALYLFTTEGYKATSIDDIMNRVGSTHSLFYHYYSSKEELLLEMVHDFREKIVQDVYSVRDAKTADEKLERVLNGILDMLKNKEKAQPVYLMLTLYFQKESLPLNEDNESGPIIFIRFKELIIAGQKEGSFLEGNSDEYAVTLVSALQGLAYSAVILGNKLPSLPNANTLMNIVRKEDRNA